MKTLIFSDTHLRIDFEDKKYIFLRKIISHADRVIINGDFWEGNGILFESFLNSSWNKLFPLLKQKNCVYIYGNHDDKTLSDNRVKRFSIHQTSRYIMKIKDRELVIEHGDLYCPFPDINIPVSSNILQFLFDQWERWMLFFFGSSYQKIFFQRFNNKIKQSIQNKLTKNQLYVCGHTHCAEIDYKHRFINTGIIRHGFAQYLMIENEIITLKEERY